MAVKTIAFMLPWVDPLSANSNLYNAGVIARIETSIADRAISAGKALEINANIFDQQLNSTDSPTFAGLTVDTNTLFVDSTNNRVGLGTTNPQEGLHVVGTIIADEVNAGSQNYTGVNYLQVTGTTVSGLLVHNTLTTGTGYITFGDGAVAGRILYNHSSDQMSFITGGVSERLTIDSAGNVGIGTTNPGATLDARRSSDGYVFRAYNNTSNLSYAEFSNTAYLWHSGTNLRFGTSSNHGFELGTNNSVRMIISNAGNVGIGTTGPSARLHVISTGGTTAEFTRSDNGQILELDGNGYSGHHTLDGTAYFIGHNSGSRGLGLQTNLTTRLFIAGGGNVGIGTTSPAYTLDTSNNAIIRVGTSGRFQGGSTSDTAMGYFEPRDLSSGHATLQSAVISGTPFELHLNPSGGNVGIGTTSPGAKLHVDGTVRLQNLPTSSGGLSSGDLWNDGGTLKIA